MHFFNASFSTLYVFIGRLVKREKWFPAMLTLMILSASFRGNALAGSALPDSISPNHALFTEVLREHVKDGLVDYKGINADQRFADYIIGLQKTDPALIRSSECLAFWVNAYNAFTIKVVIDRYPLKSIMSTFAYAVGKSNFQKKLVTINARKYSLNDIENDIVRPYGDARIHFALNCAAMSCPPLRPEAFVPERLNEQLDEQARNFINMPEHNSFDFTKQEARISKIFDWFKDDFEKNASSVLEFISRYLPAGEGEKLRAHAAAFKIEYRDYNWDLNDSDPTSARDVDDGAR